MKQAERRGLRMSIQTMVVFKKLMHSIEISRGWYGYNLYHHFVDSEKVNRLPAETS